MIIDLQLLRDLDQARHHASVAIEEELRNEHLTEADRANLSSFLALLDASARHPVMRPCREGGRQ
jgi:hypothetical protein